MSNETRVSQIRAMVQAVRNYLVVPGQWIVNHQFGIGTEGQAQYCLAGAASAYAQGNLGVADFKVYSWWSDEGTQGYDTLAKELGFTNSGKMAAFNNTHTQDEVIARLDAALVQ